MSLEPMMQPSTLATGRRVEAALRRAGHSRKPVQGLFIAGEDAAARVLAYLREALRISNAVQPGVKP